MPLQSLGIDCNGSVSKIGNRPPALNLTSVLTTSNSVTSLSGRGIVGGDNQPGVPGGNASLAYNLPMMHHNRNNYN